MFMKGKYNYSRKKKKENGDNSSGSGNFNRREDGNENKNKNKNKNKGKSKSKSKKNKNNLMSLTIKFFIHFTNVVACIEAIIKTYHFIKGIYKEVYNEIINTYRKIKDNILKIIISAKEEIDNSNNNIIKCNLLKDDTIIPVNPRLEYLRKSIFQINPDFKIFDNPENLKLEFMNELNNKSFGIDTNNGIDSSIREITVYAHELAKMKEVYYGNDMRKMENIVDIEQKDRKLEEMEEIKMGEVVEDKSNELTNINKYTLDRNEYISARTARLTEQNNLQLTKSQKELNRDAYFLKKLSTNSPEQIADLKFLYLCNEISENGIKSSETAINDIQYMPSSSDNNELKNEFEERAAFWDELDDKEVEEDIVQEQKIVREK